MPRMLYPVLLGVFWMSCSTPQETSRYEILDNELVYTNPEIYAAWPAMVRTPGGDLLATFIATDQHLGPDGVVWMVRSEDNGKTWSEPEVLYDSPIDDREGGLTVLPDGRIMAHIRSTFWTRALYDGLAPGSYPDTTLARWSTYVERPEYLDAEPMAGTWVVISDDDGHTWSDPVPGPDTIHGGIAPNDSLIVVASYREDNPAVGVYHAHRPEGPWERVALVQSPQKERLRFGEPHLVELESGTLLMMIRATAIPYDDRAEDLFMWYVTSNDNGITWSEPVQTTLWGYPPHLTRLHDGRYLVSYGHRSPPFGQRAAISEDGLNWDSTSVIILRDDADSIDLGYPVSLEVAPDTILSVYYQRRNDIPDGKVDIWATRWVVSK